MNQIGILDPLNNRKLGRPSVITVICVFGFIGVGLSIPMIFSEFSRQMGSWFAPYAGFLTIANLICMIGLWQTKKWGLSAYSTLVLINQIVLITKDEWNILILMIQGIIILIGLYHLHPETRPTYYKVALYLKKKAWAFIVAYMMGIHNAYKEVQDDPEEIIYTIDDIEEEKDSSPKD